MSRFTEVSGLLLTAAFAALLGHHAAALARQDDPNNYQCYSDGYCISLYTPPPCLEDNGEGGWETCNMFLSNPAYNWCQEKDDADCTDNWDQPRSCDGRCSLTG